MNAQVQELAPTTATGPTCFLIEPLSNPGEYHISVQLPGKSIVTNTLTTDGIQWIARIDTGDRIVERLHRTHHDAITAIAETLYRTLAIHP